MSRSGLISASVALCLLSPAAGAAEPAVLPGTPVPCSDYREVRRQLSARYGEAPVSLGLQSNGNMLQVFASARSGSWTVVSTSPAGLACILAAGRGWEALPVPDADPAA